MLNERAMLVNLFISSWSARKYDPRATAEVDSSNEAQGAGRFNKLLIDNTDLKILENIAGKARTHHYKFSLPWGDNGDRILPAELFIQYQTGFATLRDEYQRAARAFVEKYPDIVQAARKRLGKLYDPGDYPHQNDILRRFVMRMDMSPVPNEGDFRVKVGAEDERIIRESIIESVRERQLKAQNAAKQRVKETLDKFCVRMSEPDPTFRDTLVGNIKTESNLLPAFNLTDDEGMKKLSHDLDYFLTLPFMELNVLRASVDARQRAFTAARDIIHEHFQQ